MAHYVRGKDGIEKLITGRRKVKASKALIERGQEMINPDCEYLEVDDTSCTYNGQHCIAQDGFDCDVYNKLVCLDKVERKV